MNEPRGLPSATRLDSGKVLVAGPTSSEGAELCCPGTSPPPYGEVRLVTVKALLPAELEYVLEHGAQGHAELARRFAESGEEHLSRARRRAVV